MSGLEQVGRSLDGQGEPSAPKPSGGGGNTAAPQGGEDALRKYEEMSQRYKRQLMETRETNQQLSSEVSQLREAIANVGKPQEPREAPTSIDQLSKSELHEMIRDGFERGNYDAATVAMDQLAKLRAEEVATHKASEFQKGMTLQQRKAEIENRIRQRYGGEQGIDPESELYKTAEKSIANLMAQYGNDILDRQPEFLEHAFAEAHAQVVLPGIEGELDRLRRENEQLKARSMMAQGMLPPGVRRETPEDELIRLRKFDEVKKARYGRLLYPNQR